MRYTILGQDVAVRLRCPNSACAHEWDYRGQSKFYASCGFCRANVHVVRDRVHVEHCKNISNLAPRDQSQDQIASSMKVVDRGP
ncbi:MAG: hypothetical protein ACRD8W_02000 [Nitrososphaeraceae archaeon]